MGSYFRDTLHTNAWRLVLGVEAFDHDRKHRKEIETHTNTVVDKVWDSVFTDTVVDKDAVVLHF